MEQEAIDGQELPPWYVRPDDPARHPAAAEKPPAR